MNPNPNTNFIAFARLKKEKDQSFYPIFPIVDCALCDVRVSASSRVAKIKAYFYESQMIPFVYSSPRHIFFCTALYG